MKIEDRYLSVLLKTAANSSFLRLSWASAFVDCSDQCITWCRGTDSFVKYCFNKFRAIFSADPYLDEGLAKIVGLQRFSIQTIQTFKGNGCSRLISGNVFCKHQEIL